MRVLLTILHIAGIIYALAPYTAQAHEETEPAETAMRGIFDLFFVYGQLEVALWAAGFVILIVFAVLIKKPTANVAKIFFFALILVPVVVATAYVGGATFALIKTSPTGGPIHWHADFRIFHCGREIDIVDPQGFSNRVGSPVLHEHGDLRIHVEGIPPSLESISLHAFFDVIGGELTHELLAVPTNEGMFLMRNGDPCGEGATGTLQAFLWETDTDRKPWVATQRRIDDFVEYIMRPEELVPPGDCIILEFGPERERTANMCEQYEVAAVRGDLVIEK